MFNKKCFIFFSPNNTFRLVHIFALSNSDIVILIINKNKKYHRPKNNNIIFKITLNLFLAGYFYQNVPLFDTLLPFWINFTMSKVIINKWMLMNFSKFDNVQYNLIVQKCEKDEKMTNIWKKLLFLFVIWKCEGENFEKYQQRYINVVYDNFS